MAVRVSYHLRLSYMSLIENSLSYIWKYFTIPPPYFIQDLCDNLFVFRIKFLIKNAISPLFCDEMTFFSHFMQFVTVFLPALTGNSSISATAHLVFVHSVSPPTIAICSFYISSLSKRKSITLIFKIPLSSYQRFPISFLTTILGKESPVSVNGLSSTSAFSSVGIAYAD